MTDPSSDASASAAASLDDVPVTLITGKPARFADLADGPVLLVNTASRCGYTGQYAGLQELTETFRDRGFSVVGVPSNDFGAQEPGTDEQVKSFCEINYGVDFPLLGKTPVTGEGRHPLYARIEAALGADGVPAWNFHKVLVSRESVPVKAYPSGVRPADAELVADIEAEL